MNKIKLTDGCYYIEGGDYCSNIYILEDENTKIIIDSGDGKKELKEKVDLCLLTHGHMDHTGGTREDWNCFLREEDFRSEFPFYVPKYIKPLKMNKIKIGSFDLDIIHSPGHSKGSICIFEKSRKILFTGDTLFSDGWIGRTDLAGGNDRDMLNSLKNLLSKFSRKKEIRIEIPFDISSLELDINYLCSGHGTPKKL